MKSLLLLLSVAIWQLAAPSHAVADGTATTGFLGLKWGCTPDDVKKVMAGHGDVAFCRENPEAIEYGGGTFAGVPVQFWRFDFLKGKFSGVQVTFEYPHGYTDQGWPGDILTDALTSALTQKYGNPKTDRTSESVTRSWSYPKGASGSDLETITLMQSWSSSVVRLNYRNGFQETGGVPNQNPDDL